MKKLLFAVVLGLLLVAALATTALADNGPHGSGAFSSNTDQCASCHRVHTAVVGSNSLLKEDVEALCLDCHDGTGAGTNVVDGYYMQSGSNDYTGVANQAVEGANLHPLYAGGFDNAKMNTAWDGSNSLDATIPLIGRPTTSSHSMGVPGTIWGSGANGSGNGASYTLECVDCHNPHGLAGYNPGSDVKVASYRLLRWQPQGSDGFTAPTASVNWSGGAFPINTSTTVASSVSGWLVPDNFATNGTEWYTVTLSSGAATGSFAMGDYNAGNATEVYKGKNPAATENNTYIPAAINEAFFCAQCHDRYFNNSSLRNNMDQSLYCGTVGASSNQVTPPTSSASVSTIDPVRCKPFYSSIVRNGPSVWHWGDGGASGDTTFMYRHASGDIRASMDGVVASGLPGTSVSRSCAACHVAHGTAAQMTTDAQDDLSGDSALLRMDNRAECLRCHYDNVGFTLIP